MSTLATSRGGCGPGEGKSEAGKHESGEGARRSTDPMIPSRGEQMREDGGERWGKWMARQRRCTGDKKWTMSRLWL
jgi:hypothetical protein